MTFDSESGFTDKMEIIRCKSSEKHQHMTSLIDQLTIVVNAKLKKWRWIIYAYNHNMNTNFSGAQHHDINNILINLKNLLKLV